jgi:hypothetical protein
VADLGGAVGCEATVLAARGTIGLTALRPRVSLEKLCRLIYSRAA